jgi:Ca-activated chloride channel homolog
MKAFKSIGFVVIYLIHFSVSGQNKPVLSFETNSHDYGTVESAAALLSEFVVRNTGTSPLFIFRADASKDFIIEIKKKNLQPGDSTILSVKYQPKSAGLFNETIKFHSNASDKPVDFKVKGNLLKLEENPLTACFYFQTKSKTPPAQAVSPIHKGRVIDKVSKQPIPMANVQFLKGASEQAVLTGSGGNYEKDLPPGLYKVNVSSKNYQSISEQHYINRTTLPLTFELAPLIKEEPLAISKPPEPKPIQQVAVKPNVPPPPPKAPNDPKPVFKAEKPEKNVTKKEEAPVAEDLPRNLFKPNNIIFLLDVSSSMKDSLKLPLLKISMKRLLRALRDIDNVAIVSYSDGARVNVASMKANEDNKKILAYTIDTLRARGKTAGSKGINLAYDVARESFIPDGNNQIIIATDGAFSLSKEDGQLISNSGASASQKITMSVVAFGGDENIYLNWLEQLSKKGNGNFIHIEKKYEAERALFEEVKRNSKK